MRLVKKFILYYFHALIIVILKTRINTGDVCRQVGHFCGTWCQREWNDLYCVFIIENIVLK